MNECNFVLEACVDSVESAILAEKGGATRFELCGHLIIGGVSPSPALFQEINQYCQTPINVLIRPRFGDFLYSDYEFEIMKQEIKNFRDLGANGVVIGMLKSNGALDIERMKILMDLAGNMEITLHRAFDVSRDPFESLDAAKALGVQTILTSGQESSCVKGAGLIAQLVEKAGDDLQILVGAGVGPAVIGSLVEKTKAFCFHMSGKETLESEMEFRKEGVPMGLPGIGEFEIWRTKESEIRKAREILEDIYSYNK